MSGPIEILQKVKQLGGKLEVNGDKLRMLLPADCSSELKNEIRQHKGQLVALLEVQACHLSLECFPWLYIAQQVLRGEFDRADRSTVESLKIGLRGIAHSTCQGALKRLTKESKQL